MIWLDHVDAASPLISMTARAGVAEVPKAQGEMGADVQHGSRESVCDVHRGLYDAIWMWIVVSWE